jgi:hypothetical protein
MYMNKESILQMFRYLVTGDDMPPEQDTSECLVAEPEQECLEDEAPSKETILAECLL